MIHPASLPQDWPLSELREVRNLEDQHRGGRAKDSSSLPSKTCRDLEMGRKAGKGGGGLLSWSSSSLSTAGDLHPANLQSGAAPIQPYSRCHPDEQGHHELAPSPPRGTRGISWA